MIGGAQGRLWRHYADLRRSITRAGSAREALTHFHDARRSDVAGWQRATTEGHHSYRASIDPIPATVAVICVTSRPERLAELLRFVANQDHRDLELVVVTNSEAYDDVDVDAEVGPIRGAVGEVNVLRQPGTHSLGRCLNAAMATTDARFVAKFDDDDRYGPHYLSDALRAHRYAGAGVVGKHTYYAHLSTTDEYVLRFPGHEFTYSSTLAGGTLVIDRERTGRLEFEDRSLGEDRAFIRACHRMGVSTFSADRFGFIQTRGADNTWSVSREQFLEGCTVLPADDGAEVFFQ